MMNSKLTLSQLEFMSKSIFTAFIWGDLTPLDWITWVEILSCAIEIFHIWTN